MDYTVVLDGGRPWGIRLTGGSEFGQPVCIGKVSSHSRVASGTGVGDGKAKVKVGDFVKSINGVSTVGLTENEAIGLLRSATDRLVLQLVSRNEAFNSRLSQKPFPDSNDLPPVITSETLQRYLSSDDSELSASTSDSQGSVIVVVGNRKQRAVGNLVSNSSGSPASSATMSSTSTWPSSGRQGQKKQVSFNLPLTTESATSGGGSSMKQTTTSTAKPSSALKSSSTASADKPQMSYLAPPSASHYSRIHSRDKVLTPFQPSGGSTSNDPSSLRAAAANFRSQQNANVASSGGGVVSTTTPNAISTGSSPTSASSDNSYTASNVAASYRDRQREATSVVPSKTAATSPTRNPSQQPVSTASPDTGYRSSFNMQPPSLPAPPSNPELSSRPAVGTMQEARRATATANLSPNPYQQQQQQQLWVPISNQSATTLPLETGSSSTLPSNMKPSYSNQFSASDSNSGRIPAGSAVNQSTIEQSQNPSSHPVGTTKTPSSTGRVSLAATYSPQRGDMGSNFAVSNKPSNVTSQTPVSNVITSNASTPTGQVTFTSTAADTSHSRPNTAEIHPSANTLPLSTPTFPQQIADGKLTTSWNQSSPEKHSEKFSSSWSSAADGKRNGADQWLPQVAGSSSSSVSFGNEQPPIASSSSTSPPSQLSVGFGNSSNHSMQSRPPPARSRTVVSPTPTFDNHPALSQRSIPATNRPFSPTSTDQQQRWHQQQQPSPQQQQQQQQHQPFAASGIRADDAAMTPSGGTAGIRGDSREQKSMFTGQHTPAVSQSGVMTSSAARQQYPQPTVPAAASNSVAEHRVPITRASSVENSAASRQFQQVPIGSNYNSVAPEFRVQSRTNQTTAPTTRDSTGGPVQPSPMSRPMAVSLTARSNSLPSSNGELSPAGRPRMTQQPVPDVHQLGSGGQNLGSPLQPMQSQSSITSASISMSGMPPPHRQLPPQQATNPTNTYGPAGVEHGVRSVPPPNVVGQMRHAQPQVTPQQQNNYDIGTASSENRFTQHAGQQSGPHSESGVAVARPFPPSASSEGRTVVTGQNRPFSPSSMVPGGSNNVWMSAANDGGVGRPFSPQRVLQQQAEHRPFSPTTASWSAHENAQYSAGPPVVTNNSQNRRPDVNESYQPNVDRQPRVTAPQPAAGGTPVGGVGRQLFSPTFAQQSTNVFPIQNVNFVQPTDRSTANRPFSPTSHSASLSGPMHQQVDKNQSAYGQMTPLSSLPANQNRPYQADYGNPEASHVFGVGYPAERRPFSPDRSVTSLPGHLQQSGSVGQPSSPGTFTLPEVDRQGPTPPTAQSQPFPGDWSRQQLTMSPPPTTLLGNLNYANSAVSSMQHAGYQPPTSQPTNIATTADPSGIGQINRPNNFTPTTSSSTVGHQQYSNQLQQYEAGHTAGGMSSFEGRPFSPSFSVKSPVSQPLGGGVLQPESRPFSPSYQHNMPRSVDARLQAMSPTPPSPAAPAAAAPVRPAGAGYVRDVVSALTNSAAAGAPNVQQQQQQPPQHYQTQLPPNQRNNSGSNWAAASPRIEAQPQPISTMPNRFAVGTDRGPMVTSNSTAATSATGDEYHPQPLSPTSPTKFSDFNKQPNHDNNLVFGYQGNRPNSASTAGDRRPFSPSFGNASANTSTDAQKPPAAYRPFSPQVPHNKPMEPVGSRVAAVSHGFNTQNSPTRPTSASAGSRFETTGHDPYGRVISPPPVGTAATNMSALSRPFSPPVAMMTSSSRDPMAVASPVRAESCPPADSSVPMSARSYRPVKFCPNGGGTKPTDKSRFESAQHANQLNAGFHMASSVGHVKQDTASHDNGHVRQTFDSPSTSNRLDANNDVIRPPSGLSHMSAKPVFGAGLQQSAAMTSQANEMNETAKQADNSALSVGYHAPPEMTSWNQQDARTVHDTANNSGIASAPTRGSNGTGNYWQPTTAAVEATTTTTHGSADRDGLAGQVSGSTATVLRLFGEGKTLDSMLRPPVTQSSVSTVGTAQPTGETTARSKSPWLVSDVIPSASAAASTMQQPSTKPSLDNGFPARFGSVPPTSSQQAGDYNPPPWLTSQPAAGFSTAGNPVVNGGNSNTTGVISDGGRQQGTEKQITDRGTSPITAIDVSPKQSWYGSAVASGDDVISTGDVRVPPKKLFAGTPTGRFGQSSEGVGLLRRAVTPQFASQNHSVKQTEPERCKSVTDWSRNGFHDDEHAYSDVEAGSWRGVSDRQTATAVNRMRVNMRPASADNKENAKTESRYGKLSVIYQGIGPKDEETGVPTALRNCVPDRHKKDWYKQMYTAIHKPTADGDSGSETGNRDTVPNQPSQNTNNCRRPTNGDRRIGKIENYEPGQSQVNYTGYNKPVQSKSMNVESDTEVDYGTRDSGPAYDFRSWTLQRHNEKKPYHQQQQQQQQQHQEHARQRSAPSRTGVLDEWRIRKNGEQDGTDFSNYFDERQQQLQQQQQQQQRSATLDQVLSSQNSSMRWLPVKDDDQHWLKLIDPTKDDDSNSSCRDDRSVCGASSISSRDSDARSLQRPFVADNRLTRNYHGTARALHSFRAQSARELSFKKGETLHLVHRVDKNWYEARLHGIVGIVPANYIEILTSIEEARGAASTREGQGRAKYNFTGQTELELSFRKGDMLRLIRRVDSNWYEGRVQSSNGASWGRRGIFPINYVQTLVEPQSAPTTPISSVAPSPQPGDRSGALSPVSTVSGPTRPSAPMSPVDDFDYSSEWEFETIDFNDGRRSRSSVRGGNSQLPESFDTLSSSSSRPSSSGTVKNGFQQQPFSSTTDSSDGTLRRRGNGQLDRDAANNAGGMLSFDEARRVLDELNERLRNGIEAGGTLQRTAKSGRRDPSSTDAGERQRLLPTTIADGSGSQTTYNRSAPSSKEIWNGSGGGTGKKWQLDELHRKRSAFPSYRALYNYKPRNEDELELTEGDVVEVMEQCEDGWFVGLSTATNEFGTFPGNYVELVWDVQQAN